jgi:hypothetical protein
VFTEPLPSNGRLFWLHYSEFQAFKGETETERWTYMPPFILKKWGNWAKNIYSSGSIVQKTHTWNSWEWRIRNNLETVLCAEIQRIAVAKLKTRATEVTKYKIFSLKDVHVSRYYVESYIEPYFRQTQQYTNEHSHTTYILEFIGKIGNINSSMYVVWESSLVYCCVWRK